MDFGNFAQGLTSKALVEIKDELKNMNKLLEQLIIILKGDKNDKN